MHDEVLDVCPACNQKVDVGAKEVLSHHYDAFCPKCGVLCCFVCGHVYENQPKKISASQLAEFVTDYYLTYYDHYKLLRLGQAFMNTFFPMVACPDIFYCEDHVEVTKLILDKFVDQSLK